MPDDLVRSELLSYARASIYDSENTTVARNINDAMTILCGRVYRESDPFRQINRNVPSIINCLNGELCFDEAGQVTFNPHRPESYLRNCLNVSYDPNATSPMFDAAVLEIFSNSSDPQDMFRHFMELASYISQPWRKLAVIILLHGGGSNGKTSLLGIIRRILGENTVMSGRLGDIEKNDFKIGDLDGKLMVLDDDVDGGTCIPDGFLKKISEEKPLTGQHKFKPPFEFICRAVPVMLANDYPATRDLSYGLRRRLMVIPFNRTFEPHEIKSDLFEKIWEQEAQGILNHIIRSFGVLKARGRFQESADCIEAKKEWIKRSNTLTTFIDEECELGDDYSIHIRELYQAFQHYCRDAGVRNVLSRRNFTQRLKDLKYRISIRGGEDAVWGFKLSYVGAVKNSEHTLPDLR
jgi:P4 family phage/plasmid primase-like protien